MAIGAAIAAAIVSSLVSAAATKPTNNKMVSTAEAAGGGTGGQAQDLFQAGQPQLKSSAVPQAVTPAYDPNMAAATTSLAMGQAPPPSPVGQSIIDSAIASGMPLNVPNSPMPSAQTGPAAAAGKTDIGAILGNINNAAGALSAVAPLLGLGQQNERSMHTSGAAGGQPGQSLFQLPQRNTLAQILASLPRTYNG